MGVLSKYFLEWVPSLYCHKTSKTKTSSVYLGLKSNKGELFKGNIMSY